MKRLSGVTASPTFMVGIKSLKGRLNSMTSFYYFFQPTECHLLQPPVVVFDDLFGKFVAHFFVVIPKLLEESGIWKKYAQNLDSERSINAERQSLSENANQMKPRSKGDIEIIHLKVSSISRTVL